MRLAANHPATLRDSPAGDALVVAVELIKPWPLKVLVDNGISGGTALPATRGANRRALPGAGSQDGLIAWCAAATVVLFLLGWAVTIACHRGDGRAQPAHDLRDWLAMLYDHLQQMSPYAAGPAPDWETSCGGWWATPAVWRRSWFRLVIPAFTAGLEPGRNARHHVAAESPLTLLTLAVVPLLGTHDLGVRRAVWNAPGTRSARPMAICTRRSKSD